MYWSPREPVKEDRDKRLNFIRAGLEELDEDLNIKIRVKVIRERKDGPKYP